MVKKFKKYRVTGTHVDPYTWDVLRLDQIVSIESKEKARKWAEQTYFKAHVTNVKKVKK